MTSPLSFHHTHPHNPRQAKKLLIVVHGSRAPQWKALQEAWFSGVMEVLTSEIRSTWDPSLTFLEINEPSFAEAVAEWGQRVEELAVFPFFLSESGHAGEEIPEIIQENKGGATATIIRPEGWREVLALSSERRLRALGWHDEMPVVVSGYGASHHDHLWQELVGFLRDRVAGPQAGPWYWAPSGHFLEDYHEPLRVAARAIENSGEKRAAVLAIYLGISSYQQKLIPWMIEEYPATEWLFKPDAILPDPLVESWAAGLIAAHHESRYPQESIQ